METTPCKPEGTATPAASPRIPPIAPETFSAEQAAIAQGREGLAFVRVMVQHPELYRRYIPFGERLMLEPSLPARDREILTIRTLALCDETYDAHHHVLIGGRVGLSDAEIAAAASGGAGLAPFDQALATAAEELVKVQRISDATWAALAERYSQVQLMELVFVVGNYTMLAMATKSFDMRIEDDW